MEEIKNAETVTDIDGNVYATVRIGKQVWTVENLKTTNYNDGTAIPLIKDKDEWNSFGKDDKAAYCYYDNKPDNYNKYGALYNFYAIDTGKLAPKGWHVPTDAEWEELQEYLIANGYNWDGTKEENKIAKSLAAKTNWKTDDNNDGGIGNDLSKNNRSGFSALPGGYRYLDGVFNYIGYHGCFWSATEDVAYLAFYRCIYYNSDYLYRKDDNLGCGFSVKLLRD